MADLSEMTTGEAKTFRAGLRRGVEIGLEAAARLLERKARHGKGQWQCGMVDGATSIRALDIAALVPGE